MWPFDKKNKKAKANPEKQNVNLDLENNNNDSKKEDSDNAVKKPVVKKRPVAKKKPTTNKKPAAKKKVATNKKTEKIYVGDKNKVVTLRLSHDLLSKVKKHAAENKKMTLSQFTRHLYNIELEKINNLKTKIETEVGTISTIAAEEGI